MASPLITRIYEHLPVFAQNSLCGWKGRHILKTRYGGDFPALLKFLNESQWWEEERLREYQNEHLRRLVQYVYENVPYYNRLFKERGLAPKDIEDREDLKKLPVLTKETVRSEGANLLSKAIDLKKDASHKQTSGTTGKSLDLYATHYATNYQWAVWWRHRNRFGIEFGEPSANFGGQMVVPRFVRRPPFWRENRPLRQTYLSAYHMSDKTLPAYVEMLESREFAYYSGYPSAIHILARYLQRIGHRLSRPPRIATTGSESLLPLQREAIEEWIGCPSTDQYGLGEGCANYSRCEHDIFHHDMEFCITELQDCATDGEDRIVKIIGTSLHNYAQPLLRYDTGDVGTLREGTCPCGRHTPMLAEVDGRIESYILTPSGDRVGRLSHCFKGVEHVSEGQVIQKEIERIVVRVVPLPGFCDEDRRVLTKKLRDRLGNEIAVSLEEVDEIPRSGRGKFRAVISEVDSSLQQYQR